MKIKQSFIYRCNDVTMKEMIVIKKLSKTSLLSTIYALLYPQQHNNATEIWKATASVLKIKLSDIYEVEDLPHTL